MQYISNNSSPLTSYSLLWSYHHRRILSKYITIHHPICEDKLGHNQRWTAFYQDKVEQLMIDNSCNNLNDVYRNKNAWKKLKEESTKKEQYAGVLGPWQSLLSILFLGMDGFHANGRIIIHFAKHNIMSTLQMMKDKGEDIGAAIKHYVKCMKLKMGIDLGDISTLVLTFSGPIVRKLKKIIQNLVQ